MNLERNCTVGGEDYAASDVESGCSGCAFEHAVIACQEAGPCLNFRTGESIIWIKPA